MATGRDAEAAGGAGGVDHGEDLVDTVGCGPAFAPHAQLTGKLCAPDAERVADLLIMSGSVVMWTRSSS